MIVWEKYVFLHFPKTWGTFVRYLLWKYSLIIQSGRSYEKSLPDIGNCEGKYFFDLFVIHMIFTYHYFIILWYEHHLFVPYVDNDKLTELDFFHDLQKCPWDCDACTNCDKYF